MSSENKPKRDLYDDFDGSALPKDKQNTKKKLSYTVCCVIFRHKSDGRTGDVVAKQSVWVY